ncbi:MAG: DNA mismatch repair endonuclease MutL, partial [bacterium]
KELMENSIDAGGTEITVELEDAGARLIRVSDNGAGMGPDDARIAVERHTTSKIGAIDDLSRLGSLGFRGEALYSICAVSRTVITTRRPEDEVGFLLRVEGGRIAAEEAAARNPGTTVEVGNLFYNLPARLKFLKSPRAEIQAISQFFAHFPLAYPEVGFKLVNNGADVRSLEPVESPAERVRAMVGREVAARLEEGSGTLKRMSIEAVFTSPDFTFPNRRLQIFFVNRRLVRDRKLIVAVDVAYKGLIAGGRFPLAILFLRVPPDELDANVHPTKTEIRFLREHEIHSLVYRTLRSRFVKPGADEQPRLQLVPQRAPQGLPGGTAQPATAAQKQFPLEPQPAPADEAARASGRGVQILGQFYDTFIFATIEGRPVFIDQHIASERIVYNRLKSACSSPPAQGLLLSESVEVPHYVYPLLMDNIDRLKAIGVEIEPFGERAFIVRSVIHNAGAFDPLSLLVSLANELSTAPFRAPENVMLNRLLTTAACKMAIQGGQKLTPEQMRALVEEYLEQEANRTCPHGRPIMHEITPEILNAWFKRQ